MAATPPTVFRVALVPRHDSPLRVTGAPAVRISG